MATTEEHYPPDELLAAAKAIQTAAREGREAIGRVMDEESPDVRIAFALGRVDLALDQTEDRAKAIVDRAAFFAHLAEKKRKTEEKAAPST